jgi:hypothetical protein
MVDIEVILNVFDPCPKWQVMPAPRDYREAIVHPTAAEFSTGRPWKLGQWR